MPSIASCTITRRCSRRCTILHHEAPNEFIGVPSFVSSGFIIVACYLPVKVFDDVSASGFTSGMLLGYAAYMFVHHATHHFAIQPGDWLYKARLRHMAHHYHDNANFEVAPASGTGFSTQLARGGVVSRAPDLPSPGRERLDRISTVGSRSYGRRTRETI